MLEVGDPVAVDEDVLVAADPGDRPAHREMGGVVDVEPVDLGDGRGADADRHGPPANQRLEPLALGHREGLRVADAGDPMAAGPHDDRGGDDRATGRGDADLVDADDAFEAVTPEAALETERGDDDRHRRLG